MERETLTNHDNRVGKWEKYAAKQTEKGLLLSPHEGYLKEAQRW